MDNRIAVETGVNALMPVEDGRERPDLAADP
jgi:hypothetical protein